MKKNVELLLVLRGFAADTFNQIAVICGVGVAIINDKPNHYPNQVGYLINDNINQR